MDSPAAEYACLLRETRAFLQEELESGNRFVYLSRPLKIDSPPEPCPPKPKKNPPPNEPAQLELAPPAPIESPSLYPNHLKNWDFGCAKAPGLTDRKRPHIANIGSLTIGQSRELSRQPKPNSSSGLGITEMKKMLAQAAPHISLCNPTSSVLLVLFEEQQEHRAFLEKVAQAISTHLALAEVVFVKPGAPLPQANLVLVPMPEKTPHQLTEKNILPLAPLDAYLNDQTLKRSLWNMLQTPSIRALLQ